MPYEGHGYRTPESVGDVPGDMALQRSAEGNSRETLEAALHSHRMEHKALEGRGYEEPRGGGKHGHEPDGGGMDSMIAAMMQGEEGGSSHGMGGGSSHPSGGEGPSMGLISASQDVLSAINNGDANALADAFRHIGHLMRG